MEKTPEAEVLQFPPGTLGGEWYVPTRGFQWRRDVRLTGPMDQQSSEFRYTPAYAWNRKDSGPWLHGASGEIERYPILRRRGLLSSFEKLARSPTEGGIGAFANRYGWLGRPGIVQVGRGQQAVASVAEPLSLWHWELANFDDLIQLRSAVLVVRTPRAYDAEKKKEARQLLAGRIRWSPNQKSVFYDSARREKLATDADTPRAQLHRALSRQEVLIASSEGSERERLAFGQLTPGVDLSAAELALREAINERLARNVDVAMTPQGEIRFWPRDLLTAVYLLLALDLSGARPVQKVCRNPRCPYGGTFFMKRRDQQYCNKSCREQARYHRPPIGKQKKGS